MRRPPASASPSEWVDWFVDEAIEIMLSLALLAFVGWAIWSCVVSVIF